MLHLCDMTHSYVWHDAFMCVTWLIHMCGTTHSCVWHDSFICWCLSVSYRADIFHVCVRHETHSYVWRDSFMCAACLIRLTHCNTHCNTHRNTLVSLTATHTVTHTVTLTATHTCPMHTCCTALSYVWHDSFIRVSWLIHKCVTTHSYVWFDTCCNSQNQQLS